MTCLLYNFTARAKTFYYHVRVYYYFVVFTQTEKLGNVNLTLFSNKIKKNTMGGTRGQYNECQWDQTLKVILQ